jgi:hypothetical protein
MSFREALAAVGCLVDDGVVSAYAIGGAMAMVFWAEPVSTFDLDVFAILPGESATLVSLATLYEWAGARGYAVQHEHIVIEGVPVQVIPAHNLLAEEAVREASTLDFEGVPVRVMRPEHLIALYLEPAARTRKRLERVASLLEDAAVDRSRLDAILSRYRLALPEVPP